MDLHLPTAGLDRYKSASQRARICTESWGAVSLYCPACDSRRISALPSGTHAADFACPSCDSRFQLNDRDEALAKLHPDNAHIRDKIRQQLQVLRDLGLLTFLAPGSYRLR